MSGKISKPGIYDIPFEEYVADPCAEPSLNSHGARQLVDDCPAKYWHDSPMNPNRPEPAGKKHFDIGHAAHELVLHGVEGFKERVHVLGEDCNLQTKAGREERDEAKAAGKTVIRWDEACAVHAMRDALAEHEFAGNAFVNGQPEPTLIYREPEFGVLCRCRPDWLPAMPIHVPDYKTALSARPDAFERAIFNFGYHQQAAWYLDGIAALTGEKPRSFFFVVQEKEPPFVVTCMVLADEDVQWGRIKNRKALDLFARCLERGTWPGYADDVVQVRLPYFAENKLQEAHNLGRFDPESEAA